MKVMVLGLRGIPDIQGGVETHVQHLYPRIASRGWHVEVLVRTPSVPSDQRWFGNIRLRRIWCPRVRGLEAIVHSLLGVLYAGLARPDILHVHAIGPALVTPLARLLGLTVVVTHHGPDYDREKWGTLARWVLRTGEWAGMKCSNARIAISRVILDLIHDKYGRSADLIPNGVVVRTASTEPGYVDSIGLTSGRYFLQVGRVVPEKRQLDLIRAYRALQPTAWKLVIVGGLSLDEYSRQVQAEAAAAGAQLTGFQTGTALHELYSHAGAFVLPSSHEGLPIALLEALSYGLPVLASNIPANLEVGLDGSSYFPLGDVPALSEGLRRLTKQPQDERSRLARRRFVSQQYDWDKIADKTLKVYARFS